MLPGLTTEMLEPFADRIMVGFESCRAHYKHPEKICVTGTPVRTDFFDLTKEQAKEKLGVDDGRPLVVSFWGSLGASGMNAEMADCLALEAKNESFHHIHGAGSGGYPKLLAALEERDVDLAAHPAIQVREYIYDMGTVMRAADLVLCRAGASTISELTALGYRRTCSILRDPERRTATAAAMAKLGIRDATERIYETVLEVCDRRPGEKR